MESFIRFRREIRRMFRPSNKESVVVRVI